MASNGNNGALLTGATGFLGSALLRELDTTGRTVYALVRPQFKLDRIESLLDRPDLGLINSDPKTLNAEFALQSIGTIIHAATEDGRGSVPIASILDAALILPVRLAELGIKYGSCALINIDSFINNFHGAYSDLLNYSLSKLTLLNWLECLFPNIMVVNAVLERMYGPYDSRSKFIETMIQDIAIERAPSVDLTTGINGAFSSTSRTWYRQS